MYLFKRGSDLKKICLWNNELMFHCLGFADNVVFYTDNFYADCSCKTGLRILPKTRICTQKNSIQGTEFKLNSEKYIVFRNLPLHKFSLPMGNGKCALNVRMETASRWEWYFDVIELTNRSLPPNLSIIVW